MKTFLTSVKGKIIAGSATAVTIGAVIVAALVITSGYRTIAVEALTGVTSIINAGKTQDAYVGQHLKDGDDATVGAQSDITLLLDDDKYVYGEPNTHFWVEAKGKKNDARTTIHLDKGSVLNRLDNKLGEAEVYQVDTPNSTMSVRGTVFRVSVIEEGNGDTYTIIEVFEGEVYVQVKYESGISTSQSRSLLAGESAIVRSNSEISEFVEENGSIVREIEYRKIPKASARFLGLAIDYGHVLCIGKDLLYDYVEIESHKFAQEVKTVDATCSDKGYVYEICTVCGLEVEKEIIPRKKHTYKKTEIPPTCTEDGSRTVICTDCDDVSEEVIIPATGHTFGDWVVTKQPTADEDGIKIRECENCDEQEEEIIPRLPAVVNIIPEIAQIDDITPGVVPSAPSPAPSPAPSSDDGSYDDDKCASGHSWGSPTVVDPTCQSAGSSTKVCSRCGKKSVTRIAKLDHTYTAAAGFAPSSPNTHIRRCTTCNQDIELPCSFTLRGTGAGTHLNVCSDCSNSSETACSRDYYETSDSEHWAICKCGEIVPGTTESHLSSRGTWTDGDVCAKCKKRHVTG